MKVSSGAYENTSTLNIVMEDMDDLKTMIEALTDAYNFRLYRKVASDSEHMGKVYRVLCDLRERQ